MNGHRCSGLPKSVHWYPYNVISLEERACDKQRKVNIRKASTRNPTQSCVQGRAELPKYDFARSVCHELAGWKVPAKLWEASSFHDVPNRICYNARCSAQARWRRGVCNGGGNDMSVPSCGETRPSPAWPRSVPRYGASTSTVGMILTISVCSRWIFDKASTIHPSNLGSSDLVAAWTPWLEPKGLVCTHANTARFFLAFARVYMGTMQGRVALFGCTWGMILRLCEVLFFLTVRFCRWGCSRDKFARTDAADEGSRAWLYACKFRSSNIVCAHATMVYASRSRWLVVM